MLLLVPLHPLESRVEGLRQRLNSQGILDCGPFLDRPCRSAITKPEWFDVVFSSQLEELGAGAW